MFASAPPPPSLLTNTRQPTGAFVHESALSTSSVVNHHDPCVALASLCIRQAWGPVVQFVADGLQTAGALHNDISFTQLYQVSTAKRTIGTTTVLTAHNIPTSSSSSGRGGKSRGSSSGPQGVAAQKRRLEASAIRAALLVLVQHSIVTARRVIPMPKNKQSNSTLRTMKRTHGSFTGPPGMCVYRYHPERALRLTCRYAKFVEYMKKALDNTAAQVVQTLLLEGRVRTVDLVLRTLQTQQQDSGAAAAASSSEQHHKYTQRERVVEALAKLVSGGFVEPFPQLQDPPAEDDDDDDDDMDGEFEFEGPAHKRAKVGEEGKPVATDSNKAAEKSEDPAVIKLLQSNSYYKSNLPLDCVWRINVTMFHDSLRAFAVGRLVAELYGHRIQSAGSLVTGALKYRASLEHGRARTLAAAAAAAAQDGGGGASVRDSDTAFFSPSDILKYLPKSVLQLMEQKVGGATRGIFQAFVELSEATGPGSGIAGLTVVRRVGEDKFEIAHASLIRYLRDRMVHQIVHDRHGQVAARILAILSNQGWLEADTVARSAMIPAKDTRTVLHTLYRSRYLDSFQVTTSKHYNPSNTIYLWCVQKDRLRKRISDDVLMALRQLRLRRQHESQVVGKDWIERAQQAHDTDENEHETDKRNYQKFCLGLERLDVAIQQLDETLMVLMDY